MGRSEHAGSQRSIQAVREEETHVGRPPTPDETIQEIKRLAGETDLSIRKIKKALKETRREDISRGVVGRVVKEVRSEGNSGPMLTFCMLTFCTYPKRTPTHLPRPLESAFLLWG